LWLQVLPAKTDSATVDPRLRLQEAANAPRLKSTPEISSGLNLGGASRPLGKKDEALRLLERAAQLRPQAG